MAMSAPVFRRPAPAAAQPPHAWPVCTLDALPGLLAEGGWSLVEFWAPDNLFCRLLAPVRARVPGSHADRLRLLCCTVDAACPATVVFGASALPALVLFDGARRVRRWLGAVDPSLLLHEVDRALAGAAL